MHALMEANPNRIVVVDKDDTICNNKGHSYPNITDFLAEQRLKNRATVLATRAMGNDEIRSQLGDEVCQHFNEIFTGALSSSRIAYYFDHNGKLKPIAGDYYKYELPFEEHASIIAFLAEQGVNVYKVPFCEPDFKLEDQKAMAAILRLRQDGEWRSNSDDTRLPDDKRYQNPNFETGGTSKDLLLLRHLLVDRNYPGNYEAVMIGNDSDLCTTQSEPNTPLITVAGPAWLTRKRIYALLDTLLGEQSAAAAFDAISATGERKNIKRRYIPQCPQELGIPVFRKTTLGESTFYLGTYFKENKKISGRVILESPAVIEM